MKSEDFDDVGEWRQFSAGGGAVPEHFNLQREPDAQRLRVARTGDASGMCGWASPSVSLDGGQYYRLAFSYSSTVEGYWEAQFFRDDWERQADFYTAGLPDTCGTERSVQWFFPGKYHADRCRVVIWPGRQGAVDMRGPRLNAASDQRAWEWFCSIGEDVPAPRSGSPAEEGARFLKETRRRLEDNSGSSPIRIVSYGDSTGFDVGNAPLDLALERICRGLDVQMHTRGWGSVGWDTLCEDSQLRKYIYPVQPDLVICHGVSTEPAKIRVCLPRLINKIRKECNAELLLVTNHRGTGPGEDERGEAHWNECARATREVGRDQQCGVVDFRRAMRELMRDSRPPADRLRWYLRDQQCHLNLRGRYVALDTILRHLMPGESIADL